MAKEKDELTTSCSPEDRSGKDQPEKTSADIFSRGPTKEELKELRAAAEKHKNAQVKLLETFGVLWNSQVDFAIASGNMDEIRVAMSQRLGFFDNCSCKPCDLRPGPMCW